MNNGNTCGAWEVCLQLSKLLPPLKQHGIVFYSAGEITVNCLARHIWKGRKGVMTRHLTGALQSNLWQLARHPSSTRKHALNLTGPPIKGRAHRSRAHLTTTVNSTLQRNGDTYAGSSPSLQRQVQYGKRTEFPKVLIAPPQKKSNCTTAWQPSLTGTGNQQGMPTMLPDTYILWSQSTPDEISDYSPLLEHVQIRDHLLWIAQAQW